MDFGPVIREDNVVELFPQIGGLVIEDNVEIFPFTAIGRGTLDDTIIHKGVKIDHCCQIAHNVNLGENSIITANSVICGSVRIGENSWIGSGTVIRNGLHLGDNTLVGIGSVVVKNFKQGNLVLAGNPAKILD